MLVEDLQPSSIVEDRGFQKFLKVLDLRYIPPSRRSIMRDHIPKIYDEVKEEFKSLLQNEVQFCTITTDLWTSRTTMGFMTVTCHFLTNEWELKSIVLDTPRIDVSHTAENLKAALLTITDDWGITTKISCAITDNANNIVAAIRGTGWQHLPCFAHTINLIVTNSIPEVPEVEQIIQSAKNIISFFHQSSKASDKLQTVQTQQNLQQQKLIQHVETWWNSVFFMLEHLVEQDPAVRTALCLLDRNDLILPTEKVTIIREVIEILRPFEIVTREMSADSYISISKIIPLSKSLQRMAGSGGGTAIAGSLVEKLSTRMMRKFSGIEENRLLASSTLLDPRLKKLAFSDAGTADRIARSLSSEAASQTSSDVNNTPDPTDSPSNANSDQVTLNSGQSGEADTLKTSAPGVLGSMPQQKSSNI